VTGTPLVATATVTGSIACFGGTGTVTVTVTGGTAPYVGDGVQTAAAGNWNYTVADANGCTVTSNNVTITEPSKVQGSVSATSATCGQTDGSAAVTASGGVSPYTYLWSDGQTTATASNLAPGTYTVTITDANGCTESASGTVSGTGGTPGSAGVISGAAGVCRNSTQTYSISAVSGATGYNWTLPAGATGSSTTNSITVTFGSTYNGGFICVTPVNSCGSGTQSCLSIPVITLKPVQPGTITFSGPFCGPTVVTCQVAPVANATSYTWMVSGSAATITSGQGTRVIQLNIPAGFTNAQISVYASNCVGNSLTRIQNIIGLPTQTQTLTGPLYLCPNSTQNYSVVAAYGATSYSWSVSGSAQILTSAGTNAVVKTLVGWTGGVLTVTATNACGSTPRSYTLYAGPLQPGGITGPANNLCAAAGVTSATYSIAAVTGATSYTWTVPTGMTITSNTGTSITVSISGALATGSVCVTASNSCGTSAARCLAVSSRPPVPGSVTGPSSVCKSQTGVAYAIAPVTGATGYIWGISGGATISGTGTTGTASFTGSTNTSVTVSVVASNQCGNGTNSRKSVTVNLLCRDNNLSTDLSINAFPNPTSGKVTVSFNANNEDRYMVRLTDLLGKEIYSYEVNAVVGLNVKDIDLSQAAAGVYLLNVRTESGESRTLRLVVE
jgi:TM2 domain-containing membrane protein YozV